MSRGRVHVSAGRVLVVRVTPPPACTVDIRTDSALRAEVSVSPIAAGDASPEYHAEYVGRLRAGLPWPVTTRLAVVVCNGTHQPYNLTIHVTVWPTVGGIVTWWALAFLVVIGVRWKGHLADSQSYEATLTHIGGDLVFVVGEFFVFGVIAVTALRLLGVMATLKRPG